MILFEFLIGFVVELVLLLIAELLAELGLWTVDETLRDLKRQPGKLVWLGYVLLGSLAGGLSVVLLPNRLIPTSGTYGLSLLLAPLATGFIMGAWGEHREVYRKKVGSLMTFRAGFLFALSMAAVRFWFIALPELQAGGA